MVYLAMLLHSAISAGTYLIAKRALLIVGPFELALVRFALAALCFGALLAMLRVRLARKDLPMMVLLGLIGVPLNQGLFLTGLSFTSSGHAALLYALTPIFVFIIARARRAERVSALKLAGIGIAFAGVAVVLFARGLAPASVGAPTVAGLDRALVGDLLILLGVIAWAVYAVIGKPYAERYGALATTGTSIICGTLLYLPFGILATDFKRVLASPPHFWLMIAYLVIVTSVIAYFLYYWSLARTEASKVAIFSNLQPVMTAGLAWAIYGEKLTSSFAAGGVMVIAGVFLTERS